MRNEGENRSGLRDSEVPDQGRSVKAAGGEAEQVVLARLRDATVMAVVESSQERNYLMVVRSNF